MSVRRQKSIDHLYCSLGRWLKWIKKKTVPHTKKINMPTTVNVRNNDWHILNILLLESGTFRAIKTKKTCQQHHEKNGGKVFNANLIFS